VNWFWRDGFAFHVGEWLTFALVILLIFALCIVLIRLLFRLFRRERDTDESDSDYWRIHGG
jgi:Kef-type K+ transport system membrane component KefB